MLNLKAKLLAAGLVTAEQIKKVEDEEVARKERERERRETQRASRDQRDARRGQGRPASKHPDKQGARGGGRRDDADERRAARDHKEEEAQRWRKRLDELKASPKSEQYDIIRGWVQRHRLDDRTAVPSEEASRFHFARADGTIGHVTLEPDVRERLAAGEAGLLAFMGFNGVEHAVVPADLARDVAHVKPEWLRSLLGVTIAVSDASTDANTDANTDASTDASTDHGAERNAEPSAESPLDSSAGPNLDPSAEPNTDPSAGRSADPSPDPCPDAASNQGAAVPRAVTGG